MTTTNDWLQQGIAAIRAGRKDQARQLLLRAVQADQNNDDAWVWLAAVMTDDPVRMRQCLQQALRINPLNARARQGIAWLDQHAGHASQASPSASAPVSSQGSSAPSSSDAKHAASVQAPGPTQQASSVADRGGLPPPSAVNEPSTTSSSSASAPSVSTYSFQLPSDAGSPRSDTSTEKPARRFSLFGKSNPSATSMATAAAAAAGVGATGATMPAPAAPAAPAAEPRRKEKVLPPEEGDPVRDCCPYCGEVNKPDRKQCRRCDRSLMIRGPVREKRSPWLSILGIIWILGGVLGILLAIAGLIVALWQYSSIMGDLSGFPLIIVVIVVVIALFYGGQIAIARAMMNRARWAYWIIAVLTALQLGGSLLGALGAAAAISTALAEAQAFLPVPEAAAAATALTGVFGIIVLVDVVIRAFFMLLVGLSWRDFYGPKERFVSEVRGNTDYELFNTGLALQRKGMWWMAMKQWEAAVANSPRDVDYLHALSVAYAKLEQWDKARETIARAIKIAPDSQALKQIQERIERMGAAQAS